MPQAYKHTPPDNEVECVLALLAWHYAGGREGKESRSEVQAAERMRIVQRNREEKELTIFEGRAWVVIYT